MNLSTTRLSIINSQLKRIEEIINDQTPSVSSSPLKVGVDLGTSCIVVIAINIQNEIAAAFLEWSDVVKDGVVLDYWKAIQLVKKLVGQVESKCNTTVKAVSTSFPPGTDPYISINVIKAAGYEVEAIVDEPTSFAGLLNLQNGAVVDIGGGTTGISVVEAGKVVYVADEPTGGHHVTLTIAGNRKISYEEAELLKRNDSSGNLKAIVAPVFQKMTDIVQEHITGYTVDEIYLTGGTCCFPGITDVFSETFPDKKIIKPYNPLYSTPLAITSYQNKKV
jgi:ethanolamine utilization protein EutJ